MIVSPVFPEWSIYSLLFWIFKKVYPVSADTRFSVAASPCDWLINLHNTSAPLIINNPSSASKLLYFSSSQDTYLDDERDPLQVMLHNRRTLLFQFQCAIMVTWPVLGKIITSASSDLLSDWDSTFSHSVLCVCFVCVCCGNRSLCSCTNRQIENPRRWPWRTEEFPW